jgi:hypothetical protein
LLARFSVCARWRFLLSALIFCSSLLKHPSFYYFHNGGKLFLGFRLVLALSYRFAAGVFLILSALR